MDRQPDSPGRVLQAALDRLADPQGGVGREAEALAPIELLTGAYQAEHALLDEVAQGQALVLVAPRVGGDEAQVGVDEQLLGVQVAALDPLGEVDLLGRCQQGVAARVRKQLVDRLGDERVGRAQVDPLDRAVEPSGGSRSSVYRGVGLDVVGLLEDPLGLGDYGGVAKILHTVLLIRYFESELYAPIVALSIIRSGGFQTTPFDVPHPATC